MSIRFTAVLQVCLGFVILSFVVISFLQLHESALSTATYTVAAIADTGIPELSDETSIARKDEQHSTLKSSSMNVTTITAKASPTNAPNKKNKKSDRPEYFFPEIPRFDLIPKDRLAWSIRRHHKLSIDWVNRSLTSPLAKRLWDHQHNCSLGVGNFQWRKKVFGMGSDLHVWSQALCNGMEEGVRVRTRGDEREWVWYDQERCNSSNRGALSSSMEASTMSCYFPSIELQCPQDEVTVRNNASMIPEIPNPIKSKCDAIMKDYNISDFRAAAMELLFSQLSPVLVEEAERQLNLVFHELDDAVPTDRLVTVHIRWGDKKFETKLLSVIDYVNGVHRVLQEGADGSAASENDVVHIFLATEDPEAVEAFVQAAPTSWNIHVDQFLYEILPYRAAFAAANDTIPYNVMPRLSRDLRGKPGLWSLGSLLVAMEAKYYVLTTSSNWSRLMNELRKNVKDTGCGHPSCTYMVDLKFGEW